jgi:DNA-binding NarL/FixJ family response regulator
MLRFASRANGKANMTVVSPDPGPTSVLVVGTDPGVRSAIARLLGLDETVAVVGTATSRKRGSTRTADVVIDEALLQELAHLSVAEFISTVRSFPAAPGKPSRHLRSVTGRRDMRALLSEREMQVVKLVAEGLSNKQISLRLRLSDKTVKNHISHILAKLGLSARTQVAVHAIRAGLV